jgi:hypothetical protein
MVREEMKMAASRNEATGDVLANVKGDADKYADGWERIFGKKQRTQPPESCRKCEDCGWSVSSTTGENHGRTI